MSKRCLLSLSRFGRHTEKRRRLSAQCKTTPGLSVTASESLLVLINHGWILNITIWGNLLQFCVGANWGWKTSDSITNGYSQPSRPCFVMKWNESGFRPPLCTYRLNWARRTSCGWWDDWDDTVLQTQDSKFEPWRSEAEHATSRSRRLPTILTFTRGWGRNIFCFFETAETGNRTPNSGVKGSGANHYPRAPARRAL